MSKFLLFIRTPVILAPGPPLLLVTHLTASEEGRRENQAAALLHSQGVARLLVQGLNPSLRGCLPLCLAHKRKELVLTIKVKPEPTQSNI